MKTEFQSPAYYLIDMDTTLTLSITGAIDDEISGTAAYYINGVVGIMMVFGPFFWYVTLRDLPLYKLYLIESNQSAQANGF